MSIENLGSMKTVYGTNKANGRMILYVLPVFVLVGFVLIGRLPIGGILMLLVAAVLLAGYFMQRKAMVEVHENGLRGRDWMGRQFCLLWSEVAEIYVKIGYHQQTGHPNQWVFLVHKNNGEKITLNMAYENIRNLGLTVQAESLKFLLPEAQKTLEAGGTVSFGDQVALNKKGLVSGGNSLPWEKVGRIEFTRVGTVTIRKTGQPLPWKLLMHSRVANFPVFRTCLHEVVIGTPAELLLEDPGFEKHEAEENKPRANIGTLSAKVGVDVRDLIMEGYDLKDVHRVASGEMTLAELRQQGPKGRKSKE